MGSVARVLCLWAVLAGGGSLAAAEEPLAALDRRLAAGEVLLEFEREGGRGWLRSLLAALDVPVSSQTLVFSKTSAQFRLIHPGNPRAVYFNDDVYIGWVRGGPILELSSADPAGVGVFYTLDQKPAERPRFDRDRGMCLQCHESARSQGIPGHFVRSVFPSPDGQPLFAAGSANVLDTTPMVERWGGWYVSGSMGGAHRGNSLYATIEAVDAWEKAPAESRVDLRARFDPGPYLSPGSDPVALLVLTHQVQMHNYIARAGQEARRALAYRDEMGARFGAASSELLGSVKRRIERPAEDMLKRLLFSGEAALPGRVEPVSSFAEEFERRGPFDARGRSLRQFDLERRMFRYPCSYLVYSDAFRSLPAETTAYMHRRLGEILSGQDRSADYAHLTGDDRQALREILVETGVVPASVFAR